MPKRFAWQWDVANEYFLDADPSGINPNDFWVANLGPGIIPRAFKRAHEVGPHALRSTEELQYESLWRRVPLGM